MTSKSCKNARAARGAAILPDGLLNERVVNVGQAALLLGISRCTFRRGVARGELPKPIKLSTRRFGWKVRDLLACIEDRRAA